MTLCQCGCGEPTKLAPQTRRKKGWVKGEPQRFLHGHHQTQNHFRHGIDWVEMDRGFATSCWIWQHGGNKYGYGKTKLRGRTLAAHRVVYERLKGPIPDRRPLDHLCRVTSCVNPEHLEPVTTAENTRRGASAKLSLEQVAEICQRAAAGELNTEKVYELAEEWGVWRHTIRNVARGYTWADTPRRRVSRSA
jgi:hypothetical protein